MVRITYRGEVVVSQLLYFTPNFSIRRLTMFQKQRVLAVVMAMIVVGMLCAGSALAADKIVWKSSGHGPATDPS